MIRQFRPEDAGLCNQVIRSCIGMDSTLSARARQKLLDEETPELMLKRSGLFYLAVYTGAQGIAGLAGLDHNELRLLYIAPEAQRLGIGRALLNHLEAMVPAALFAEIFVYASLPAAGFYAARGYRDRGECLFELDGEVIPTVFMTKPTMKFTKYVEGGFPWRQNR